MNREPLPLENRRRSACLVRFHQRHSASRISVFLSFERSKSSSRARSVVVVTLMSTATALAAEPPPGLALPPVEVVGTTPLDGLGVPLSRFPSNAQRLDANDIGEQANTNLADLLNDKLGPISVSNGSGNPYQNDINYRGFQATSLLGAPVGLSVYFDGVRVNEAFGAIVNWDLIPMHAISSVSILPGSNPIFGLNTLGGALSISTKNGKDDAGTRLEFSGGSFGRRALVVESGWVDSAHDTDYFVSGNLDRQNGFRQHSDSRVSQWYGKSRWHGNQGRTHLEMSAALADTSLSGTQSLPQDMLGDPGAAYTWPDFGENRMLLVNLKGMHQLGEHDHVAANAFYRRSSAHTVNSNANLDDGCFNPDGSLAGTPGVPLCANQAPGGTALNAVTGASALAQGYGLWTSAIDSSLVDSRIRQETVGTSVQWTHAADWLGRAHAMVLGASIDQSSVGYQQNTALARLVNGQTVVIPNQAYGFTSDGAPPTPQNPVVFSGSNLLGGATLTSRTTDLSLFLTDTFKLLPRLNVTFSGSYNATLLRQDGANHQDLGQDGSYAWTDSVSGLSYYNPAYVNAYTFSNDGGGAATTPVGIPAGALAGPQTNSLAGRHRYRRFNPALGVNVDLGARQSLFANYSEAMRAPTSIELSCADPNHPCALPTGFNGDPDLKPVIAKTFEFGGRGRFDIGLAWNAAVYDSRLRNDIQFIATSSSFGYFANVGDTERRGAEAGLSLSLEAYQLSASYGFVDARYTSPFTTAAGQAVSSGDRIPGIPRQTLKLRLTQAIGREWRIGGNLLLVGDQITHGNESNADPQGKVAGYGLLNLDLHWKPRPDLEISANVGNVLDKRYSTYGLSGTTSIYSLLTQNFYTPAAPRSIQLSLRYAFGGKAGGGDVD